MITSRVLRISGPAEAAGHPASAVLAQRVLDQLGAQGREAAGILLVRRVTVRLHGSASAGGSQAAVRWLARPRGEQRIYRPAHEWVPPSAQAVAFSNWRELLSCLARDVGAGVAAGCWWWPLARAAAGSQADALEAAACVLRQPTQPRPLLPRDEERASCAEEQQVVMPARQGRIPLSGQEASGARGLAAVTGGDPAGCPVWHEDAPPGVRALPRRARGGREWPAAATGPQATAAPAGAGTASPIHPLYPADDAPRAGEEVLRAEPPPAAGLPLGPHVAQESSGCEPAGAPPCVASPARRTARSAGEARAGRASSTPAALAPALPAPPLQTLSREGGPAAPAGSRPAGAFLARDEPLAAAPCVDSGNAARSGRFRGGTAQGSPRAPAASVADLSPPAAWCQAPMRAAPVACPSGAEPHAVLQSPHASIAYLLNAAIACGLYRDFRSPRDIERLGGALPVSPWRFLCDAASAWLRPLQLDPALRALLLELDGETSQAARSDGPREQARRPIPWQRRTLPRLARRLHEALGTRTRADLVGLLFRPGTLVLSSGRLDIHLSLEHLPIEVRLAGLDRNPGFIPAAGRIVEFHYG